MSAGPPPKFKVVFLGDEACGKTSLVRRYTYDSFEESVQTTVGMDFQSKTVHLEDRSVRLQLWDTAGQERFRSLIPSYIRDAAAAIVVYDITKRASFLSTRKWMADVRADRGDMAKIALVGNKCDRANEREVTVEEGRAQAEELGAVHAETSAKDGTNVEALFKQMAAAFPAPVAKGDAGAPGAEDARGANIQLSAGDHKRSKAKKCNC
ncbi:unnamed protein product [Prorocentrum cordatum]|uniref:Ras-related protein Rab-6 n=1 Tax=Prorocentrum cordatum TaxID=2364126 RepID=A0ABN9SWZ4_9DINO|nr:unnamed protein product [Polarella glacialis]|mmetsp:Transcript_3746/g.9959  ORF Transcript_3746/g.9959 Transcript_3746/m.9959 type:complete len:209 (-) Transcript_3746:108-734(-)